MSKKKEWIGLIAAYIGAVLGLVGIMLYNINIRGGLPPVPRMLVTIGSRVLLMIIPIIVMIISRDKLSDYGFSKEKIGIQIAIGAMLGLVISVFLTLIPHLAGFGEYVDNGNRYNKAWMFVYDFTFFIFGVGLSEEFVFRGLIYEKIRRISGKDSIAVIVSSIMFGFIHLFGGNLIQVAITSVIGIIFAVLRLKIKRCSTLSLIVLHGVYDAMITVWASVFFG